MILVEPLASVSKGKLTQNTITLTYNSPNVMVSFVLLGDLKDDDAGI